MGIAFIVILFRRQMFCEQFMYDIIIDGTTLEWNIHVKRRKGSINFV